MLKEIKENWEKEINEILITLTDKTGFNHSNESIDAFNLAEAGLVELLKSEKEKWEVEGIIAIDKKVLEHLKREQGTDEFYETIVKPIERQVTERLLEKIKEKSKKLPIEIERTHPDYRQGMHAGIDLCIDILITDLEELKEEIKNEL